MDPAQLGHWVSHQIATHCEPVFEAEQERAHAKRYLTHHRDADGSLTGRFRLSAEDSEAFLTALEPLARRHRDLDTRTAGQRRADALVELSEQVLRHGELGDAGGLRPQLSYVLPADWAARPARRSHLHQRADRAAPTTSRCPSPTPSPRRCPATAGSGPSRPAPPPPGPDRRPAPGSRRCCATPGSPASCSPHSGQVTGFQPLRDSVTPAQRRNLAARDLGCVVRGCTRPPAMCDAHHVRARADGGPTTMDNLVLLRLSHEWRASACWAASPSDDAAWL